MKYNPESHHLETTKSGKSPPHKFSPILKLHKYKNISNAFAILNVITSIKQQS